MPIYVYRVILEGGVEGPEFEYRQGANDEVLKVHPVTGHKVERVLQMPNISAKYTKGRDDRVKDSQYLEKNGFLRYERDKLTGKYHKTAGKEGPEAL